MSKRAQVASHVPGRIRLKLHPQGRDQETMAGIQTKLQSLEGIDDVRLNPAAGSVTVNYDRERHSMAGILGFLEDLDVVVDSIGHLQMFWLRVFWDEIVKVARKEIPEPDWNQGVEEFWAGAPPSKVSAVDFDDLLTAGDD